MKAIVVSQPGSAEQLIYQDFQIPTPNDNQILVKLKTIGINYIDIYFRSGAYKTEYPFIPGKEGCGEIVAIGKNVQHLKIGDRVAFCNGNSGSYAEYTIVDEQQAVPVPQQLSDEIVTAALLQGLTAYYLAHLTFPLNKNHTALIHAGAGGVGLLLIQIAKSLGTKVITTVSSAAKADLAKSAGADEVINYADKDFANKVLELTQNKGVNVVYDAVGKDTFEQSIKCLAIRGMLVLYGQASGPVGPVDLSVLSAKSLFITRPVLFHYIATRDELLTLSQALFDLILHKGLQVQIGQRYALQDAVKAHKDLEERRTVGKSILYVA